MDDLTCSTNIEWLNKQGTLTRKVAYKNGSLRLLRNESKKIFIEVSSEKSSPLRFELKGITVHNKYMKEGKATIKFEPIYCTIMLSNAPPSQLLQFLKTMFIKMTGSKPADSTPNKQSLRTHVLSNQSKAFDEISPVTDLEVGKALAKVSKGSATTPSPLASKKRKLERDGEHRGPAAKKLYIANDVLDMEQKEVLQACLGGANVFFTGSAGTGKSYLLKKIIGALPPDVTTATASTGVAACLIGGITLHQFAGIGKGDHSIERSAELASRPPAGINWKRCKHLIIDEISMVDAEFFTKIDQVARRVRRNDKPFGGIQLILCGDFLQLPPVSSKLDAKSFCFQSASWLEARLNVFELKQVHRQTDHKFIDILNKIRMGRVDPMVTDALAATTKQKIEKDGILATRLCSHTRDADTINESKLAALTTEARTFEAQDQVPGTTKQLDQQTPVSSRLVLKIGAQVMLLKNINVSQGLVNGARGVVTDFRSDSGLPVVQFRNKREYVAQHERWLIKTASGGTISRRQVPLKLAWAFSIHKSQGLTLDCVEMSLGRVFEAGQAYVALSRAKSLETLRVLDFKSSQVWANPTVLDFYRNIDQTRIIPLGVRNRAPVEKSRLKGKLIKSKLFDKPIVNIC